jgi:hypothetical protein
MRMVVRGVVILFISRVAVPDRCWRLERGEVWRLETLKMRVEAGDTER